MKLLKSSLLIVLVFAFTSCKSSSTKDKGSVAVSTQTQEQINVQEEASQETPKSKSELGDGMYAEFQTTKGDIILSLEFQKTPGTVANFVSLAEGTNTEVDDKFKGKHFYDGLKFHRVIANFMIQGGDPQGTGRGGPGYKFGDEFPRDNEGKLLLTHKDAGVFSMANSGPNTNGSQFFITHNKTAHLDGKHTVFGHVVLGQDVVNAIAQDDIMNKVVIIRKGSAAKKFDAPNVFKAFLAETKLRIEKEKQELKARAANAEIEMKKMAALIATNKAKANRLPSGLGMFILEKGSGVKPEKDAKVLISYAGFFENGRLFDTCIEEVAKRFNRHDKRRAQANAYKPFSIAYNDQARLVDGFREGMLHMSYGEKAMLFIPSELGYGERGAGRNIPPNTDLVFEIQIVDDRQ